MKINQAVEGEFFKPLKGIYKITNTVTGRVYIGQSKEVQSRLSKHFAQLGGGVHTARLMQEDWIEYGASSFTAEILEHVDGQDKRLIREAEIIAEMIVNGREVYNTNVYDPETIKNNLNTRDARRIAREEAAAEKRTALALKRQAREIEHDAKEARRHSSSQNPARRKNDIHGSGEIFRPESVPSLAGDQQELRFPEADIRPVPERVDRTAETEGPPAASMDENGLSGESGRDVSEVLPECEDYNDNANGDYLGRAGVSDDQWDEDIYTIACHIEDDTINGDSLAWFLRTYVREDILEKTKELLDGTLLFFRFTEEDKDAVLRKADNLGMTFGEMIAAIADGRLKLSAPASP